jgi:hypothetical protein
MDEMRRGAGLRCAPNLALNRKEATMSAAGTWNLRMETPLGERSSELVLTGAGGNLSGTQSAEGVTGNIFDASETGDSVRWKISITNPMPLTLEFKGTVSGDKMSGEVDSGAFGAWPFEGRRA